MKILLICSAGTSTSLLVKKMQDYCKEVKKTHVISALGSHEAKTKHGDYDVFLLGPQVAFMKDGLKEIVNPKPLDVIPPMMYGRLDAKGVVKMAENMKKK
jgi:PTS system cellobiose-specific IIB component